MPHLLVAVSSHGFGHAAQTAPVVNVVRRLRPDLKVTLRTDLPRKFLASRFEGPFDVMPGVGDFGLNMQSALAVDRTASAERYAALHTEWERHVAAEAKRIATAGIDMVLSNVSYLALAGAQAAGVTSVLLCSFTWSLVYQHYFRHRPEAEKVLTDMRRAYAESDLVLALEPGMPLDVPRFQSVGVISRQGRFDRAQLLQHLGLLDAVKLVVVSLGGIDHPLNLQAWPETPGIHWLVPKAALGSRMDMSGQEDLPFHFTDLLASSDGFITKPGYGAFTEAACNNVPVLYVPRNDWPEEPYLTEWLRAVGPPSSAISSDALQSGDILPALERLWRAPRSERVIPRGAEQAAAQIAQTL